MAALFGLTKAAFVIFHIEKVFFHTLSDNGHFRLWGTIRIISEISYYFGSLPNIIYRGKHPAGSFLSINVCIRVAFVIMPNEACLKDFYILHQGLSSSLTGNFEQKLQLNINIIR